MANRTPTVPPSSAGRVTRFDGEHVQRSDMEPELSSVAIQEPDQAELSAVAGQDIAVNSRQLSRQASQLATHLRTRQHELDLRESNLNARVAQLENELRIARLSIKDRERALDDLNKGKKQREQAATASPEMRAAEKEAECRKTELDEWSRELAKRQRRLEDADAILQRQLKDIEAQSAKSQELLEAERAAFELEREQFQEEITQFNRQAAVAKANVETRLGQLQGREKAARQLRDDAFRIQRESLELRLATQQLSLEIGDETSRGERMQTLSRIRQRLADQLDLERQELDQQSHSLQELATKLDDRAEKLRHLRGESQVWLSRRELEIEEQAARLASREIELNRERQAVHEKQKKWARERHQLQSQIRELLTKGDS